MCHNLAAKLAISTHKIAPKCILRSDPKVVLPQKMKSIRYRIDVQSFTLLLKSAHKNGLAALLPRISTQKTLKKNVGGDVSCKSVS